MASCRNFNTLLAIDSSQLYVKSV